jgi:ATP phosphoribosyltransferase
LLDLDEVAEEFKKKKKRLLRVATKYPNLTRKFLYSKGVTQFQLVQSLGSTEVTPFTGTAEVISDITSTGATLKANNLRILKDGEILKSQACIMQSKLSTKKVGIKKIINLLSK